MKPREAAPEPADFNRRDFIRHTSFGSLMLALGGVPIEAAAAAAGDAKPEEVAYDTNPPPVALGIIGCGLRGREIAQTLRRLVNVHGKPFGPVVALCDTYEPFMVRTQRDHAPEAQTFTDYHQLLAQKTVEAVVVATPSHQHHDIVAAALQAGKHVYCEAPLATTIEDARAIAQAANAARLVNFQSGLQLRSDPQNWKNLQPLILAGAMGEPSLARSQWHKKQSWRRQSPDADREKVLNWRLDQATSPGLMGELGIHQMDLITFFLRKLPTAVTGWGGILNWKDGRDVPDTIQTVVEYPRGVNFMYDASLGNSFDGGYDMLYGTNAAIMLRDGKAWFFKEKDAPLLGWEVYARHEQFYEEKGIVLDPDMDRQIFANRPAPVVKPALEHALVAFVNNCDFKRRLVREFIEAFGVDAMEDLPAYVAESMKNAEVQKKIKPAAGAREGFEATVTALKANEAISRGNGTRIVLQPEWYQF